MDPVGALGNSAEAWEGRDSGRRRRGRTGAESSRKSLGLGWMRSPSGNSSPWERAGSEMESSPRGKGVGPEQGRGLERRWTGSLVPTASAPVPSLSGWKL